MAVIMTIREKFGYVLVGGIAVAIILFVLGDLFGNRIGGAQPTSNEVGVVEGQPISINTFNIRLDRNVENFKQNTGTTEVDEIQMANIRQQTWDEMVREILLAREFEELGIAVTEAEVHEMFFGQNPHELIKQYFTDPQTGTFEPTRVQQYLQSIDQDDPNGPTGAEKRAQWNNLEQYIIRSRLEGKYTNLMKQAFTYPTWYTNAYIGYAKASVNIEYVLLPYTSVADDQVQVTDSDLEAYLKKHRKQFEQEESRSIEYMVFQIKPNQADTLEAAERLNVMFADFKETKNDSTFINRNSATKYEGKYYRLEELTMTSLKDTFFSIDTMTYVGPYLENGMFTVAKLMDRKMLPDSVEVATIDWQATNQASFDSIIAIADTLVKQINEGAVTWEQALQQQGLDSATLASKGVKGWVKEATPDVIPEFSKKQALFQKKQGEAILYADQTGFIQITYVNTSVPTQTAVKVAFLSEPISASKNTGKLYYDQANEFFNANNTGEKFAGLTDGKQSAPKIKKSDAFVFGLGGAREFVKSVYNAQKGDVLPPQLLGDKYVVAYVKEVTEKGLPSVDAVRGQLEAVVRQEKKAQILKDKIGSDSDLNSIASKNGTTVNMAQNLNLNNNNIANYPEPTVSGAALALQAGQVSKPVVGKQGVYVIKVTSTTPGQVAADGGVDIQMLQRLETSRADIENGFFNALEKDAEIVDERYKFF